MNQREMIRNKMEKQNNIVLFASFGTLSVGINIKNLHCLIFSHPFKARIRTLQSIGRVLRKSSGKECATIIDVIDNFSRNRTNNTTYLHRKRKIADL